MNAPKRRAIGPAVIAGWTRWPKHRDSTAAGPAAADGWEEAQRQWVAAMRVREAANHRRRQAAWS